MTAVLNTDSGATLVSKINTTPINGTCTIQGGAGGTLKEYFCTPSGTTSLLKAKAGVTIIGDGPGLVRINTALQLPPGGAWAGPSGGRWTWTGALPGPTKNTDIPTGGFLFPQQQYFETVLADGVPLWKIGVKLSTGTVSPTGRTATQVGTVSEPPTTGDGSGPLSTLYAGQCFLDYQAGTITINVDPALHRIEVTRPAANIFDSQNTGVTVSGVEAYGANIGFRAGGATGSVGGDNQVFRDVLATACVRGCQSAAPADSLLVERLEAAWCFQYGITGQGDFMTISQPYIHHCNHGKLYNTTGGNYGSGGSKFVNTGVQGAAGSGITVTAPAGQYGLWEYNEGSGPWLDLSNIECLIERQVCRHLGGHGIHYEVSYKGTVQDNIIYDVQMGGIYISTSRDVTVRRNQVWLSGLGSSNQWALRNLDTNRSQAALWGTHRGINNTYDSNTVWIETANTALEHGGQESFTPSDGLGYSSITWTANTYYVAAVDTAFHWSSGAVNYAAWQALGNDVGSVRGDPATPYPPDPFTSPTAPGLRVAATGSSLYVTA